MQSSLAHCRKGLNFSHFLFPEKISRRDIQQQVGFRKQCTNGLLFSLRIRHTACSGFGEFLHTSISRCLWSLVSVFQGSVLGTSPALTRTKERRLQSLTGGRMPAVLVRPRGLRPSPLPLCHSAHRHQGRCANLKVELHQDSLTCWFYGIVSKQDSHI